MGSTVSLGRRAGAFRGHDGQVYYVLFERTFETNCYPYDPREGCVAFGTLGEVLGVIMGLTGETGGGMLRRSGGNFTPLGYLRSWLKALREVRSYRDHGVRLKAGRGVFDSVRTHDWDGHPTGALEVAVAQLHALGYAAAADALEQGRPVDLSVHADAALLARLYGPSGVLGAPWKALDRGKLGAAVAPGTLAPVWRTSAAPLPLPPTYRFGRGADGDGTLLLADRGGGEYAFALGWEALRWLLGGPSLAIQCRADPLRALDLARRIIAAVAAPVSLPEAPDAVELAFAPGTWDRRVRDQLRALLLSCGVPPERCAAYPTVRMDALRRGGANPAAFAFELRHACSVWVPPGVQPPADSRDLFSAPRAIAA